MNSKKPIWFLIDDDLDDHEFFRMALSEIDQVIECISFTNAIDALHQLKESVLLPDVIFLDLNMPMMSGKECLANIRSMAHLPQIPVMIYSTSSDRRDKEETRQLGATDFLTKPSSIRALVDMLQDVFVNKMH